jgi:hypothetical protein
LLFTDEQKSEALHRIIESPGFHRAEVLKTLLDYLCRQEAAGRSHEVTEYEVAIKALGRGPEFSPETDSSVRTRFLALRKKLDEYYAGEGSNAPLRIDIPRGTYALRFVPPPELKPAESPAQAPGAPPPPRPMRPFLLGAAAGIALLIVFAGAWRFVLATTEAAQERSLRSAWGPMLDRGSSVTIAIGTPASLFVRDFGNAEEPLGDPGYRLPVPRDAQFAEWYRGVRNSSLGKTAILHPNAHSPLWGDAAAATVISRVLGSYGVGVEVAPSARVHPVALRERNVIIIGRPEYTTTAGAFLPEDGLSVEYSAADRAVGIRNRAPKAGEPKWWFATGGLRHNFGLITVLTADSGSRKRTILFAGINSDGAEAGARYFTSPDKLDELNRRFQQAGYQDWPPRYQIVVRTESLDTYSLQTRFEFLHVLK